MYWGLRIWKTKGMKEWSADHFQEEELDILSSVNLPLLVILRRLHVLIYKMEIEIVPASGILHEN